MANAGPEAKAAAGPGPHSECTPLKGRGSDEDYGGPIHCEMRRLWAISFPMVLSSISGYIMSLSSLVILGMFAGPHDLAGASLGTTFSNVCGCSMLVGLSEAIDTLCSQAFGAGRFRTMGWILQRGLLLLMLASTAAAILFWHSANLLLFFGQDPALAHHAGIYVRYQIPGIYGYAVCMALQRFLSAQGIARPLFWVSAGALPFHVVTTWVLVHPLHLGCMGAAIGWSLSFCCRALVMTMYTWHLEKGKCEEQRCCIQFSMKQATRDWSRLLAVSLPAYAMLATEWWTFEILTMLSGLLPNPETQVIANTICSNVIGFMFMFHLGISVAVCVRVGAALGAMRTDCVKRTIASSIAICLLQWAVVGGIFMTPPVRKHLSLLFAPPSSGNPAQSGEIQQLVSLCIVYVVIQQFFDGLKEVFNGAIRGSGRQAVGMGTSFIAYIVVCIPLGYCLAFEKLGQSWAPGIPGLFIATVVASTLHSFLNFAVIVATDWDAEALRTKALLYRQRSSKASAAGLGLERSRIGHGDPLHPPNLHTRSNVEPISFSNMPHSTNSSRPMTPTMTPTKGSEMMFASVALQHPPPLRNSSISAASSRSHTTRQTCIARTRTNTQAHMRMHEKITPSYQRHKRFTPD